VTPWDPRCRVLGVLALAGAAAGVQTLPAVLGALLLALAGAGLCRVRPRAFFERIGLLFIGLVPFAIAAWLGATWESAVSSTVRGLAVGLFGSVLFWAGPVSETFAAVQSLGVPGRVVAVGRLAERYAGLLFAELRRTRRAARARGFAGRNATVYGHLAAGVLARSIGRADSVASAMQARGFGGTFVPTERLQLRWRDVACLLTCLFLAGGLIVYDRLGG
jgi:energy-coupling factor transporter transmembrane protein EcfT